MRRLFWVALGAATGVAAARQVRKKAEAFTANGIGRSVVRFIDSVKAFAEDVRAGMAEREQELSAVLQDDRASDRAVFRQLVGADRPVTTTATVNGGSTDGER